MYLIVSCRTKLKGNWILFGYGLELSLYNLYINNPVITNFLGILNACRLASNISYLYYRKPDESKYRGVEHLHCIDVSSLLPLYPMAYLPYLRYHFHIHWLFPYILLVIFQLNTSCRTLNDYETAYMETREVCI